VSARASWEFEQGDAIAPERFALKQLGGGSRYEAYLVWDEVMFAICVAKVLRPDQVSDEKALRDLRREWETLDGLAHPVILRGFDAVLDGDHPHLLIEHLEGPTLRRLIKRGGPLPLEQLLPLALNIAGALQYLRRSEVVHLDVKPDNIVMGVPPRLIDLSVARSFERAAKTTGIVGTDAYMAPEQCDPERFAGRIGHPSDVWGLGATLHHAIRGEVPFPRSTAARRSEDPTERFPQLDSEPEPLPDWVPTDLSELIESMLAPDPGARPGADEVAARLEPLVAAQPSKLVLSRRGMLG